MKKVFSVFLAIILTFISSYTGTVYALDINSQSDIKIWGGLTSATGSGKFYFGDGTEENPYIIENGDQLYKMVSDMGKTNGQASYYKLANDIYLNDISDYQSWGKSGFDMSKLNNWVEYQDYFCHRAFAGNFNGDGHTIYGLYAQGYRSASFFPNNTLGAVVRNVNFKNSYVVNTANTDANDCEDDGETLAQQIWYAGVYASAGVIFSRCDSGDGDHNTVDYTIKNCSVQDAYVEATYFTSAIVAASNSCQPYVANCMVANVTLNSTDTKKGVEGAIINMPYGSTNATALMENVVAIGLQIYGAQAEYMWSGKKTPAVSHTYTFKNVYSTVSNKYTVNHSSYGNLSFTDSEVTVVDASKLIGAEAEKTISAFDWAYTWRSVEGGYPVPLREYVVPTGEEYYQNGGAKYTTDMWDGTASTHFAAGNGTQQDPYLIANCEEFYLMATTPQTDKYYKIANGVTDLYFNDVTDKTYSWLMTYFSWGWGSNYAVSDEICFNANFDGNGVTFHGVRSNNDNYTGLFPRIGNATLKNFTVKNSYFKTKNSSSQGAGAISSAIAENSTVNIKNIAVIDCNIEGKTNAGGFIGNAEADTNVYIKNSIFSGGKVASGGQTFFNSAFVGDAKECTVLLQNCISLGAYPVSDAVTAYTSKNSGVYTDTAASSDDIQNTVSGINVVQNDMLLGENAQTTCAEFDWTHAWSVTDSVPMPKVISFENGIVGSAWSGEIAVSFAGGNGTESNPYQINTAEMLARMLMLGNSGEYYKLTANIYINDITREDWYKTATKWFTSSNVTAFEGALNGNGFTVYGLYADIDTENEYAALIPILGTSAQINKLNVDNAYLTGGKGTHLGSVAGMAEDNAVVSPGIFACTVGKNVRFSGEANVGGIISNIGFTKVRIENCSFNGDINASGTTYGIIGNVTGEAVVQDSISVNAIPFNDTLSINSENVYTNVGESTEDIILLDIDKMQGTNAKNNMTALDFSTCWKTVANDIPAPTGNTKTYNGIKGEVWSGKTASSFAGGKGTASNPYIIETGEQLALALSARYNNSTATFKLGCDIYLNDIYSELWQNKAGCINWIHSSKSGTFAGTLDGNGYVVYGMCHYYKGTPKSSYLALIPRIGGSATVKNLGVSEAYIKADTNEQSIYAGGIFGMGSAFYDFYGNKTGIDQTVNDEFLVPGTTTPKKLPSVENCFVDHTCYIEANGVGGIGCPGGAAMVIRDCYVTATLAGNSDTTVGALMGPVWNNCSRIYNSVAFPQTECKSLVGNQQWIEDKGAECTYIENVYYYGKIYIYGTTRVKRHTWRIGDEAKTAMPDLDWENTWRIEQDGTPVLCVFDKDEHSASVFSDKYFVVPNSTIHFVTGADDVIVDDMVGEPYSLVDLPTPKRQGYKFVAWHAFSDLTYEYPYEYFIAWDITLYAEWEEIGIVQDFENYPFTEWDCDSKVWNYNTPDSENEYSSDFIHSGNSSMQLMTGSTDVVNLLINYEKTLTAGQSYMLSMWVATENEDVQPQIALSHMVYPDYLAADKLTEPLYQNGEVQDKWKQYTYAFTAQTPWVSIKVLCNDTVYFDDIIITPTGDLINDLNAANDIAEGEYYTSILNTITLSKGTKQIGEFAFAYSEFVTDVFIADTVTQIDEYAFYDCDRLTDIWYEGSPEQYEAIKIADNNTSFANATIHFNSCKLGSLHTYDNDCDIDCNECTQERTVGDHVYDGPTDTDCNSCGKERELYKKGDINGDTTINNRDLAILMQYLNGWPVEITAEAADVNADDSVNNRDYALLMQYINGWPVELK